MGLHQWPWLAPLGAIGLILAVAAGARSVMADPVTAQSSSTFSFGEKDGSKTIEINNVTYDTTSSGVPGRPQGEQLVLRTTTHSKQNVDEEGGDFTVGVEAWPLGTDLATKPIYAVTLEGVGATVQDGNVILFDRGIEDVSWWSVYTLGSGTLLFDTYVPLLSFSLSRQVGEPRYVGLDVPPDDEADPKLKDPQIVGVLAYAAADHVIRRLLFTCSDTKRAAELRSYYDETRELSVSNATPAADNPRLTLRLAWSANFPSAPNTVQALIPLKGDDLDAEHAKLPACMKVAAWTD
ncbi:MAG TPA: hypothetical protein VMQ73_25780 [Methylomirabilota bacterium]|nr:hypothetical protein [Methylomirabilota bacterium]